MREVVVGIVIKAKDQAGAGFDKIRSSATTMSKGVAAAVERAKDTMKSLGGAAIAINQAFELGKKVLGGLKAGFDATVGASLAQRKEGDAQRQAWESFGNQVEKIQGLLGDILLPIILGVADAFKPLLKAMDTYLTQNKQLIGAGIIEWLQSAASMLVSGVATGVVLVSKAWTGWKLIINGVGLVIASVFSGLMSWYSTVLGATESVAKAMGQDGLASSIGTAKGAIEEFGKAADQSSDKFLASMAEDIAAQDALERKISEVEGALQSGIATAGVNAMARLGQEVKKIPPDFEKVAKAAEDAAQRAIKAFDYLETVRGGKAAIRASNEEAANARLEADTQRTYDSVMGMELTNQDQLLAAKKAYEDNYASLSYESSKEIETKLGKRSQEFAEERAQGMMDTLVSAGNAVAGAFKSAFAGIGENGKTLADGFKQLGASLKDMIMEAALSFVAAKLIEVGAQKVAALFAIESNAAVAASGAAASQAAIPVAGPILAAAAMAAMLALVLGLAGSFHTGGVIPGTPGQERLALVQSGEGVIRSEFVPMAQSLGMIPGGGGSSSRPSVVGPGLGRTNVAVTVETLLPSRASVMQTDARHLRTARMRASRLGVKG